MPSLLRLTPLALTAVLAGCAGMTKNVESPTTPDDARAFFDRYVALSAAFDPAQVELYADDCRVGALRHTAAGDIRLELAGDSFKKSFRQALQAAPRSDRESFSDVVITPTRGGARVTAHRYSQLKCTHDDQFKLELEPDDTGALRIVYAFQENWATSLCGLGEGKTPAQRFDEIVGATAPVLPLKVDEETRLDTLTHENDELTYGYTIVRGDASQVDMAVLEAGLRPELISQTCQKLPHLAAALRDGGRVSYVYADRSGVPLVRITLRQQDCG